MNQPLTRVLLYSHEYPPAAGGMGTHTYEMARWANAAGVQATVMAPNCERDTSGFDKEQSFQTIRYRGKGTKRDLLSAILHLFSFWRKHVGEYDFVYCTSTYGQIAASILSRVIPIRYCVTAYGSEVLLYRGSAFARLASSGLYDRAFAISCYSEFTRALLLRNFPRLSPGKIFVQWPGVDGTRFCHPCSDPETHRKALGLPSRAFILLSVARLDPRKGHDVVIRALGDLKREELSGLYYVIVGTGAWEGDLRRMVSSFGLEEHVIFAGAIGYLTPQLVSYYDSCDIFVLPSRQEGRTVEGYGIVFNEAGARGKPSVAGNHGGVPEAVQHDKTGLLVDPLDHVQVAEAIRRLRGDMRWRSWLGTNARTRVAEELTWERVVVRTYAELIGRL